MERESRIYVSGHTGLLGTALTKKLREEGYRNLITIRHEEVDLTDTAATRDLFAQSEIDYVFATAARVGGIGANREQPAEFLVDNAMISMNLLSAAAEAQVKKLIYVASSCLYPKDAPQPINEEAILSGKLEPTNEGYGLAKILGLKLCEYYYRQYGKRFLSVIPTNLYGDWPKSNLRELSASHAIPALMCRLHEAKVNGAAGVTVWGSGEAKREFLHAEDLASALLFVMDHYESPAPLNIGSGEEVTIAELARLIAKVVGFKGKIRFDASMPDGMPRKCLDSTRMRTLGWRPIIDLKSGLERSYRFLLATGALNR